jgi:hypothetical protein
MMLRAGAAERRNSLGEFFSWITVLRVRRIYPSHSCAR